ncbi:hypothetical protein ACH5RR_023736 [Cinchona calisaya]|uniref:Uncharacterized protein n=1 Tax=Cinchona calisaya TaxID=153742 RepID=A0ABD2ZCZ6_9GENT
MVGFPKEVGGEKESWLGGTGKGRVKIYTRGGREEFAWKGKWLKRGWQRDLLAKGESYVKGRDLRREGARDEEKMEGRNLWRKGCIGGTCRIMAPRKDKGKQVFMSHKETHSEKNLSIMKKEWRNFMT